MHAFKIMIFHFYIITTWYQNLKEFIFSKFRKRNPLIHQRFHWQTLAKVTREMAAHSTNCCSEED